MKRERYFFWTSLFFLFCTKSGLAQTEGKDLQGRLSAFHRHYAPEKLFLHTDKDFYTAGELLWFKVYAVDGSLHKPSTASKLTYVEILDEANLPVVRAKISMGEKGGNGSVQLPFGMKTGNFTLRAYTSWMKNLGAAHFFEKNISVVNTLKTPEATEEKIDLSPTIQLFPEGGNLVSGLASRVAFLATDPFGNGIEGKGFLLSGHDTLVSFQPFRFGMGHFTFTPQKGRKYRVAFQPDKGKMLFQSLDSVFDTGYTLQLTEVGESVTIKVATNVVAGNSELFLLAQTRQVVKAAQKAITSNGIAEFTIARKLLGEGVSQFTVFNVDQQPVCERLYFIPPTNQTIHLNAAKEHYETREKVNLALSAAPLPSDNLSLAVYQLDDWQQQEGLGIDHYLWLTSELSGPVENPAFYFSGSAEAKQSADYLMMTQGWRRFRWQDLEKPPVVNFPVERADHIVSGIVTDTKTKLPAADVQVYLSVPSSAYKLFTAISDSLGRVQFNVKDYYGDGEMIVQTSGQLKTSYSVNLLSPFAETYYPSRAKPLILDSSRQAALVNRSIAMQTGQLYRGDSLREFRLPVLQDTLPFYGKPMYSYRLDDYVRFSTMEEVLREYVREINVGVKGSGESLRLKLFNEPDRRLYQDDILVMVDGIPLFKPNKVFALDPLTIKSLEVIPRNYVFGHANFHGIANFISYAGQHPALELDPTAITIDYAGLQLQRTFRSPVYASEGQRHNRLPDLRTTLFWQPDVTTSEISFYTGDNKGRFVALLQGISANGQAISAAFPFEVN